MTWDDAKRRLVIEADARTGVQAPRERTFDVLVLPEKTLKRVTFSGKPLVVPF